MKVGAEPYQLRKAHCLAARCVLTRFLEGPTSPLPALIEAVTSMETAYVAVRTQVLGDGPFVGPDLTQFAALKEVLGEVREKGEQQDERPESVGAEVMVEEGGRAR